MQIQADRFLALTAMLAGFVPTGANPQGGASEQVEEAAAAAKQPVEAREARSTRLPPSARLPDPHGDDVRRGG